MTIEAVSVLNILWPKPTIRNPAFRAFAILLPTAMHPWMDPHTETLLWPHGNRDIYHTYNRIFNCQGHGWSNLQSVHVNLAFKGDEEFGRLHGAIRLLLPLLPALAITSPCLTTWSALTRISEL